ncbi:MAG: hypothetical protein RL385_5783 [Pseudomonadota bacterium]
MRPVEADATGGYYRPVRIALESGAAFVFRHRITCRLAAAPVTDAQRYAREATPNLAPDFGEVDEESLRVHATYSAGSASAVELAADPGAELQLTRNAAELPAWVWLTLRDDRGASTLRTLVLGSAAP